MKTRKLLLRCENGVKVLVPPMVWVVDEQGKTIGLHASSRRIPNGCRLATEDEAYAAAQAHAEEVSREP